MKGSFAQAQEMDLHAVVAFHPAGAFQELQLIILDGMAVRGLQVFCEISAVGILKQAAPPIENDPAIVQHQDELAGKRNPCGHETSLQRKVMLDSHSLCGKHAGEAGLAQALDELRLR